MRVKFTKDCWLWLGTKSKDGYGVITYLTKQFSVHRLMYLVFKGKIGNNIVRHTCDNRACINPTHLVKGTHADNVKDRVQRERSASGGYNGKSKVSLDTSLLIQKDLSEGFKVTPLAKKYGFDKKIIRQIRDRQHWTQR